MGFSGVEGLIRVSEEGLQVWAGEFWRASRLTQRVLSDYAAEHLCPMLKQKSPKLKPCTRNPYTLNPISLNRWG